MKKCFLLMGILLGCYAANSQILISLLLGDKLNSGKIEFGLDGGWNTSSIKGIPGVENVNAFNLGFYFDIKLKHPSWMLNTGVIVKSPMGAKNLPVYSLNDVGLDTSFANGSVTRELSYFNVPITMKYTFKNNIYLKAGVQLGLINKATDEFSTKVNNDDLKYKIKNKSAFHPLDGGLAFGAGYRFMKGNGMNLGIQYYLGLVDISVDDSTPSQYNRSFYLTVGIPIGKGAAKKKAAKAGQAMPKEVE